MAEIEKVTELHRTTISRLCISLTKEHYIKRKNKQAVYQLTEKAGGDPAMIAFSLGNEGWDRISKWVSDSIATRSKYQRSHFGTHGSEGRKYANKTLKVDDLLQVIINEFATFIGALIVYHILSALSPRKVRLKSKIIDSELKIEPTDDFLFRWLKNAIKPGLIFHQFSRLPVVEGIFLPYQGGDASAYQVINKRFEKLLLAFKKLYPNIYSEMEEYRKSLPDIIDSYRSGGKGWSMGISK